MLGRIIWWLVVVGLACAMIYYSGGIVEMFWRSSWAERYVWSTRWAVVLAWMLGIIIGIMVMFWMFSSASPVDSGLWWV